MIDFNGKSNQSKVILSLEIRELCPLYIHIYIAHCAIKIIFKQIYLIHRCEPNKYYHSE